MSISRPRRTRASEVHSALDSHDSVGGLMQRESSRGEREEDGRDRERALRTERAMWRSSSRAADAGQRLVEEDEKAGAFGSPMAYEAAEPTVFQELRPSSSQGRRPRREGSMKEASGADGSGRASEEKPKLRPRTSGGRRSSARVSDAADAGLEASLRSGLEPFEHLGDGKSRKGDAQPLRRARSRAKGSRGIEEDAGEEEVEEEYEVEVDLDAGLQQRFAGREKSRPQTSGGRQGRKGKGQEEEVGEEVARAKSDASRESGERPRTSGAHRPHRKVTANSPAPVSPRQSHRGGETLDGQAQAQGDGRGERGALYSSSLKSRSSSKQPAEDRAQGGEATLEAPRVSRHRRQSSRGGEGSKEASSSRNLPSSSSAKEFAIHSWVESTVAELSRAPIGDPGPADHTGRRAQTARESSGTNPMEEDEEEDEDDVPVAGVVEFHPTPVPRMKQATSSVRRGGARGGAAGESSLDGDSRVHSSSDASSSMRAGGTTSRQAGATSRQGGARLEAAAVGPRQGGVRLEAGAVLMPHSASKSRPAQAQRLGPEEGRGGGIRRGGSVNIPAKALRGLDLEGISERGEVVEGALSPIPPRPPTASARTSQSNLMSPFLNAWGGSRAPEGEGRARAGFSGTRPATAAPSGKGRPSGRRRTEQDVREGLAPLGANALGSDVLEGRGLRHRASASDARRGQKGLESPRAALGGRQGSVASAQRQQSAVEMGDATGEEVEAAWGAGVAGREGAGEADVWVIGESAEGEWDTLDEESEGFSGVGPSAEGTHAGASTTGAMGLSSPGMPRSGSSSSAQVLPLESPRDARRSSCASASGRGGARSPQGRSRRGGAEGGEQRKGGRASEEEGARGREGHWEQGGPDAEGDRSSSALGTGGAVDTGGLQQELAAVKRRYARALQRVAEREEENERLREALRKEKGERRRAQEEVRRLTQELGALRPSDGGREGERRSHEGGERRTEGERRSGGERRREGEGKGEADHRRAKQEELAAQVAALRIPQLSLSDAWGNGTEGAPLASSPSAPPCSTAAANAEAQMNGLGDTPDRRTPRLGLFSGLGRPRTPEKGAPKEKEQVGEREREGERDRERGGVGVISVQRPVTPEGMRARLTRKNREVIRRRTSSGEGAGAQLHGDQRGPLGDGPLPWDGDSELNILGRPFVDVRTEYKVDTAELGRGRFGVIRCCSHRATGQRFACKTISKTLLQSSQDVEDVQREVSVMELLKGHPNVACLEAVFEDETDVHLVMELCEGGELFERIKAKGRYQEPESAAILRTLARVLQHCHSLGVMHRDVKPENILLLSPHSDTALKVIDFGVACFFQKGQHCTDMAGSPYYLAPEVLAEKYGPEADIWSAGVVLYILLSGLPPFWAPSNEGIFQAIQEGALNLSRPPWPSISSEAKDLVRRMLCRNPALRITLPQILEHPWITRRDE